MGCDLRSPSPRRSSPGEGAHRYGAGQFSIRIPKLPVVAGWLRPPRSAPVLGRSNGLLFSHRINSFQQLTHPTLLRPGRPHSAHAEIQFRFSGSMLIKQYGIQAGPEVWYSPPKCIGTRKRRISGQPDINLVSTSFVERQNLTLRMSNRRFTRLTNAFSKKLENHKFSLALHFMHYNFCRIHQTLRVTPAMEAGITDRVWNLEEIASLPVN